MLSPLEMKNQITKSKPILILNFNLFNLGKREAAFPVFPENCEKEKINLIEQPQSFSN